VFRTVTYRIKKLIAWVLAIAFVLLLGVGLWTVAAMV